MIEAWYSNGILGFGSDSEDARGIDHPPRIAGAYFAAKLGVSEYLLENKIQADTDSQEFINHIGDILVVLLDDKMKERELDGKN